MALNYVVSVGDEASGPLERIAAAVGALEAKFRSLGAATGGVGGRAGFGAPGIHNSWGAVNANASREGARAAREAGRIHAMASKARLDADKAWVIGHKMNEAMAAAETLKASRMQSKAAADAAKERLAHERDLVIGHKMNEARMTAETVAAERHRAAARRSAYVLGVGAEGRIAARAASRARGTALGIGDVERGLAGGNSGRSGSGGGILSLYAGLEIGRMAMRGARAVGSAGTSFITRSIKESEFRQGLETEYGASLGSRVGGSDFFGRLQNMTDMSSLKMSDIGPFAQRLLHLKGKNGMNADTAMGAVKVATDLTAGMHTDPAKFAQYTRLMFRGMQGAPLGARSWTLASEATGGNVTQEGSIQALMRLHGISHTRAEMLLSGKNKNTGGPLGRGTLYNESQVELARERNAGFGGSAREYYARRSGSTQTSTFMDAFAHTFQKTDIKPFALGLSKINDLLKEGAPSMKALQGAMNGVFQGIIQPFLDRWSDPGKLQGDVDSLISGITAMGDVANVASRALVGVVSVLGAISDAAAWATGSKTGQEQRAEKESRPRGMRDMYAAGTGRPRTDFVRIPDSTFNRYLGMQDAEEGRHLLGIRVAAADKWAKAHPGKNESATFASLVGMTDKAFARATHKGMPHHALGGLTMSQHVATVGERSEVILPLDSSRTVDALGAAMQRAGGTRGNINLNVHPGAFVIGGKMSDDERQELQASLMEMLGSMFERAAMQATGGLG